MIEDRGPRPVWANPELDEQSLMDVREESRRAVEKHGASRVLTSWEMPHGEKLACLVEEIGEVANCLTYDSGKTQEDLAGELLQVANLALAWYQAEMTMGLGG